MGVPSANQRVCGGGQRRGIGTNGGSPGTSQCPEQRGDERQCLWSQSVEIQVPRTYGAAALAAQGMMRPSVPRVLELLPGEFDLGSVNSVEHGYCRQMSASISRLSTPLGERLGSSVRHHRGRRAIDDRGEHECVLGD